MKELKRLSTGLISAIMVLSFILMPIPQTGRAWADSDTATEEKCDQPTAEYPGTSLSDYNEDRKKKDHITQEQWNKKKEEYDKYTGSNGVYKPGCEMTDAMSKASLDNPGMYKDGKIGPLLEQYIMGLFGLTMINGMLWKYLYKYNPVNYGQDCSSNWGPKLTMPLTALSGLAYVIGDAQANVKFKMASKEATDKAFATKSRNYVPGADSDEVEKAKEEGEQDPRVKAILDNKAQEDSYDTLISILESQRKAVKTKRTLARVSNIGYYAATGVELANLINCNSVCTGYQAQNAIIFKSLLSTGKIAAKAIAGTVPKPPWPGDPKCAALIGQHGAAMAQIGVDKALLKKYKVTETAVSKVEEVEAVGFFKRVWGGIKGIFSTGASTTLMANQLADAMGEKVVDEATETAKDTAKQTAENAKVAKSAVTLAQLQALDYAATKACNLIPEGLGAQMAIKLYTTQYRRWLLTSNQCCGGNGLSIATYATLKAKVSSVSTINPKTAAFLVENEGKMRAAQLKSPELISLVEGMPGTLNLQGPPTKSMFASKKDIKVGGIFTKSASLSDPKIKDLMEDRKEYLKIVMRSGLEFFLLNSYPDKLMQNPKKYIRTVAENSQKLDHIMKVFEAEVLNDLNHELANSNFDKVQDTMRKFVKKVSNILIPEAHAIGSMGMMAGGILLTMVGSQVENPWLKEVFNIGSKLMLLQGLLGKLMKDYALNRPVGRNITWAVMGGVGEAVIASLKKTQRKVERNIEVVKTEKIRYMNSAAARTGLSDGAKVKRNSGNLQAYDPTAAKNNGMKIKACAVPKGTGFAPAMCPAVIPKQRMSLPQVRKEISRSLTPDFMKGMSMMSNYAYGAASGSLDGETMSDSDLNAIEQVSNAMKAHNELLRDKVDKHNAGIKLKDGSKMPSLKRTIANFKRSMGLSPTGGSGSAADGLAASEYNRGGGRLTTNNVINKGKKPTKAAAGGKVAAVKVPDLDLDFGDDDAGGITNTDSAVGTNGQRKEEKLEDFVLQHDDINKRKDIPIWKILSNRYILSYPKILEEEDAKLEPDKVQEKKK